MADTLWTKDGKLVTCASGKLAYQDTCPCASGTCPSDGCGACCNVYELTVTGFVACSFFNAVYTMNRGASPCSTGCCWYGTGTNATSCKLYCDSTYGWTIDIGSSDVVGHSGVFSPCPPSSFLLNLGFGGFFCDPSAESVTGTLSCVPSNCSTSDCSTCPTDITVDIENIDGDCNTFNGVYSLSLVDTCHWAGSAPFGGYIELICAGTTSWTCDLYSGVEIIRFFSSNTTGCPTVGFWAFDSITPLCLGLTTTPTMEIL